MKIGFGAPVSGSWATPENMVRVARRAEELGYHSLWTFQRLLSPVDGSWGERYRSVHDPVATMAYLAGHTSRIRLGVAVLNAPYVAPVIIAKQLATVDVLSGGRLDAGLGAGWSAEEFAAVGTDMTERGERVARSIAEIRALWTADAVAYGGTQVRMEPKPVQRPHPPILLGGGAPPALRRVGRLADGWISSSRADPATLGESVAIARAAAQKAGRDPDALRFACRGAVQVRPSSHPEQRLLTGTLEKVRDDFDAIARQGITELFVDLNFDDEIASPSADPVASMRRAEEALEAFSS
ncbi:TIGR03619 family F420-dependent LLM class oxidoreductase [Micromonospora sp. CPCC 205371]|nr:TIGR03619 family F420-dependent LLM class oxidoreductase [Micromonospora sp. CPCC 205371]